ncbi:LNS2 Lipin Ned1 Smp2 [Echinococcus multilocularis]|uniref:LNS2 Lipin Ned1 Smp2 n=1 Tax=Echinococcus multilocularis TaxID=6211 RepID=A0A068XUC8_ECHMU|nr:LNS2 Lipin Ned1 Smp2 [Echinococcus multilocularis]
MQYIERFFSSAKRMYSDINSATLSGAIDVIVVRYPNGELVSSPFYVQFGKTGVFRPCADEVEVMINGVLRTDLHMRVNRFGQAYFDDPYQNAPDDESRPRSPNFDSGIQLDFHSGQSPPNSETCCSPLPLDKANKTPQSNSTTSDDKQDLLQSVSSFLQSADFSEFESNMLWWNQDNIAKHSVKIQTYRLTDEQSKAADPNSQSVNDSVWVYWENRWYSWRTANIKLRFLRNLGTPLPSYFEALQSKLMEVDRENPAFVLLPSSLPSLSEDKEQEGTQFELDQSESSEAALKPCSFDPFKSSSHEDEDDPHEDLRVSFGGNHPSSLPSTPPQSPSSNELAYFSDGHSPKNYEEEGRLDDRFNWRLHCQWGQAYNTRAFKLSSEAIKRLGLGDGTNEAVFTTINKYQGTCTCYCLIYVWNSTDKVVISDIDGTITKSDLLGHVLHWVGLEWTHPGVIQLYKKISENGYRLMYLSARSIGQANPTRNFLEGLEQDNEKLPAGPIILSPNSLITTIQMEIIQKRPQVLKISNLKRLGELFRHQNPKAPCPFFAGFGNRTSDVETYRAIGIPDSHIFIVNPEGVIETPTGIKLPTGYTALCEMTDLVFPSDQQILSGSVEYSDFSFWRDNLPTLTSP